MQSKYFPEAAMRQDGKRLPLSNSLAAFLQLLLLLLLVPVWLLLLVPLAAVSSALSAAWKRCFATRASSKVANTRKPPEAEPLTPTTDNRKYDLVLFGATGFTGKLAAMYIAKQYRSGLKWAIAGRRRDALEAIRQGLCNIDPGLNTLPIVLADSSDASSLEALARCTKVVITTAGPFAKYGSDLVKFCALNGTHYCDITGETDWTRVMIDKYDQVAKQTGARIVHFCGHDCVPWDLLTLKCSEHLAKAGDKIQSVAHYDEIPPNVSGGTLATVFHALANRVKYHSLLGFDPLLKTKDGTASQAKFNVRNVSSLVYSKERKAWVGPFFMASVMANCVRRSNALNGYSDSMSYKEGLVYPSLVAALATMLGQIYLVFALLTPPLKWLIFQLGLLPLPGDGPSQAAMDAGFLTVTTFAKGRNGKAVKAALYFPTDPGYRDTARMLVEAGMVLAVQGKEVKVGGGVWTPAACQGNLLLDRLIDTGCSFHISDA